MQENKEFNPNRNDSIAKYVVTQINVYTAHPEKKEHVKLKLMQIFSKENEDIWSRIIILNKFRAGFKQIVGVTRIRILIKLLNEIDSDLFGGLEE